MTNKELRDSGSAGIAKQKQNEIESGIVCFALLLSGIRLGVDVNWITGVLYGLVAIGTISIYPVIATALIAPISAWIAYDLVVDLGFSPGLGILLGVIALFFMAIWVTKTGAYFKSL